MACSALWAKIHRPATAPSLAPEPRGSVYYSPADIAASVSSPRPFDRYGSLKMSQRCCDCPGLAEMQLM